MNTLRIQELEAFLAVCRCGTFSAAAEETYSTQPSVSWQISSLERELGVQLFLRGRGIRRLALTEEGRLFREQAEKFSRLWRETEQLLSRDSEQYLFGCVPSIAGILFPRVMNRFRAAFPGCELEQWDRTSDQLCAEVARGRMDSALIVDPRNAEDLYSVPIAREEMVFVCRREAPYKGVQNAADLPVSKEVEFYFSDELRAWSRLHLDTSELPLTTVTSVRRPADLFTVPDAWGIIPASYSDVFPDGFRLLPLEPTPPQRPFYLISREPPRDPYFSLIRETLLEAMHRMRGFHPVDAK